MFDWLRGDPTPRTAPWGVRPVDGYWPHLQLVVEFQEEQRRHLDQAMNRVVPQGPRNHLAVPADKPADGVVAGGLLLREHLWPYAPPVPCIALKTTVCANRAGQTLRWNTCLQQQTHSEDPPQRPRDVVHLGEVGILPF